ncbi:LPS-assembly protein LptD [Bartonella bovis]|uniref:LPS-assembly protein LptD n=1 Tax=Bartonella bovis m02 TaxID=1094492 RepID=N6VJQ8_9HYPH|nr:LPS-assembly protein LptD [Bartonella bovis]ENN93446.1 organic solvent tolerance protein OstA [Bartonella bovis m02]
MKLLTSKRIILTKLNTLAFKSAISFVLGIILPYAAIAQNFNLFPQNHIQSLTSPFSLSADKLTYNHDADIVSAEGDVQIEYDNNKVIAQKVIYNQKTGRVIAQGNVEIVQKDGNKVYSDYIDMTKDLGEGFVNFLRVEAINNTHFAAENAERKGGQITIFNNAVYTACEPHHYKSDNEVFWQIKAKKIIWNSTTKTIRFEDGHFEIFGVPVVRFPAFELPDPNVKRVSGLLAPHFSYTDHLGIGIKNSYFWNFSPYYDFTLSPTFYTKQGLLIEGEWRQRLKTGNYNIRFAHIYQINPHKFDNDTIDAQKNNRYMVATKGDFRINSRWTYGWDIFAQSDRHFSRTYKLENYSNPVQLSQLYLNGLGTKNYFDMRFYHFTVQDLIPTNTFYERHSQQAWVLPRIDYFFTPDKSIYTGELTFHGNMQSIYRNHADFNYTDWQDYPFHISRPSDILGNIFRLTGEIEWKKRFNTQNGLIITPILALRTDTITTNTHENHTTHFTHDSSKKFNIVSPAIRSMATAGLELRYPLLVTSGISTHILEPTAQLFIRNNEQYAGLLPNEDAQSFVFDATTLFQRDKFSGYDRVEGGTRANIGLRYSGSFNNDWSLYGLIGQSFHLAGKNSFAEKSLANVSANSGLETSHSDYVAMLNANHDSGFSLESRGRFDKKTGQIRRGEVEASQKWTNFRASLQYAYIQKQPNYEYTQDRQEISFQTGIKFSKYWSIYNNVSYDLISGTFVKQGINLNYKDECFEIKIGYQQITNPGRNAPLQNFNFSLSLRTITDIGQKVKSDL